MNELFMFDKPLEQILFTGNRLPGNYLINHQFKWRLISRLVDHISRNDLHALILITKDILLIE